MKCPKCGMNNERCVNSAVQQDNRVYRQRLCLSCGNKFVTYEVYAPDNKCPNAKDFRAPNQTLALKRCRGNE